MCLLRGMDWMFIIDVVNFALKEIILTTGS